MPTRDSNASAFVRASAELRSSTFSCAMQTFSSALLCGKRLNCWNTIPTRRRTKSMPSTASLPVISLALEQDPTLLWGLEQVDAAQQRRLARARGPITQTTSPRLTSTLTPRSTSRSPNRLQTFSRLSIGPE